MNSASRPVRPPTCLLYYPTLHAAMSHPTLSDPILAFTRNPWDNSIREMSLLSVTIPVQGRNTRLSSTYTSTIGVSA